MSMQLTLNQDEIQEITGKKRWRAQAKVLAQMGISFRTRPDGYLVISRSHFESKMGNEGSQDQAVAPDWSSI